MSEKRFWLIINIFLIFLLGLMVVVVRQWPDDKLHLVFCDVGQGDAILVKYKHHQMLVDGGGDNSVLSCLGRSLPFWDRKLELMVLSHGESDHITGLVEVLRRYQVEQIVSNGLGMQTAGFKAFEQQAREIGQTIKAVRQGDRVKMGPIDLEVLWPAEIVMVNEFNQPESVNEHSVVMLGRYGRFEFLLTGDIGVREEEVLRLTNKLEEVEVLKVGHHGSKTSSDEKFLQLVKPELAVISVGENRFGHPNEEVLERLTAAGARIKRTDQQGEIEVVSDGKSWWTK